ncbi:hypothetical protein B0H14DRAFT_3430455 [Mycena olivaceomarginata]|nr:hypothetical protein B0H14DRAFT_3430455 [Mycena olivaceomarginata]
MRATINYSRAVDPVATDAGVAYIRQRYLIKDALTTYGTDHVAGISVGDEFILNYLTENGGSQQDPNGGVGNIGAALLLANITDTISVSLALASGQKATSFWLWYQSQSQAKG